MNPQTEYQSPEFSALGEAQPTQWEIIFDRDGDVCLRPAQFDSDGIRQVSLMPDPCEFKPVKSEFARLLRGRDTLQAIATGATLKFAGMELQRDALRDALTKLAPILDNDGPLVAAYADCRAGVESALKLCERVKS